ncbi:hypothetical protein ABFS82_06G063300 [Erythranthe guttata]|uniref:Apyrase n=1 Tax=Erythranthe guttata TaxID=4155 RepID=A0A022Q0M8_ERYGU|nr:PREDICTED: probable apyrase 7 [Erythranthe guttata]XP_012858416.1 PREDICTED: probable apyrase 7 [Erythranthe guttata]XP_012858417.1 PREDICTED: probable apyrase 7 [Erythranthe guttata]EYU20055.1 hypothetical protein MIMGU_mgv1a001966mg [Erythranthe guttata]|eukprot:XP_012858415.1 PREDICTED: probable apyrase 7 [Erythranthe guttata]
MVFSKFAELFSAQKASTYKSPGLPPMPSSVHAHPFSSSEKKTNLRHSSSLQDFSTYRQLDIENGVDIASGNRFPPFLLQKENGIKTLSKEKISPGISSTRKKWLKVICVLVILLFISFLLFALQFIYSKWSRGASKYYVVLDCGSTGTRVYVYEASINHKRDDNLPVLLKSLPESLQSVSHSGRAYKRMETEPGLGKLVNNVSGLSEAIKPLIQWAENQIPKKFHKTTSLFLCATAGVRRLPSSDSEWLLDNAYSILKNSRFLCKKEWVKVITGMEEAYYGWIALNYHTGVLGAIPKKETYGALDLGGSSLQVTFEGKQDKYDETSLNLSIGSVNHHLSAYSLSGFGLNDAFDKSVAYIIKGLKKITDSDLASGKVEIKHPCLQSGYKELYICSHCSSELGKGEKSGAPVQLVGAPNWEECRALAKVAVNLSEWNNHSRGSDCEVNPCALAENLPRPMGHFYAMSGFYVVYRFFNLTSDSTLDDVLEKGREFCDKNWDVARESVVPQPFIEQYCFRAPYVVLLLREGLHITDGQVIVGSGSITWTLGVALFEAGKAFAYSAELRSYYIFRVKINPFVLFAVLFASLFILLCALSCAGKWWVPKFLRRQYLPLYRHNNNSVKSGSVLNIPSPFRFRWSRPIDIGDGRAKTPLSPTVGVGGGGGGGIEFAESSLYSPARSVPHSQSSGSLRKMQFDSNNNNLGSFWTPDRSQMRLQSRRSQSREDLSASIAEVH